MHFYPCNYSCMLLTIFPVNITVYITFRQKKENSINVGAATLKDFMAYRTKMKKTPDEIIRFFLRLAIEPGQSVLTMSDEIAKGFEVVKSALKAKPERTMKHLLITREKYL